MGRPKFADLGDLGSVAATPAASIGSLESAAVLVGGTFVGTYSVNVSFDAGATFVPHPDHTGLTAPKVCVLGMRVDAVQVDCTAYTSGTLENKLGGSDDDRVG
jgi:hypothetical protein